MPRITSTTPASMHVIESSGDSSVATVRQGETKLSEVATRLGADHGALLQANPNLSPSTRLKAGQEIRLAQGQASPAVVDQLPAKSGLPSAPMGDPLAKSAMQASLNTKIDGAKQIHSTGRLQASQLTGPFNTLHKAMKDSLSTHQAASDLVESAKSDLDSMSEMGETESLRLQMAMDRLSKMMSTLSNLLKKVSDTSQSITQNMK